MPADRDRDNDIDRDEHEHGTSTSGVMPTRDSQRSLSSNRADAADADGENKTTKIGRSSRRRKRKIKVSQLSVELEEERRIKAVQAERRRGRSGVLHIPPAIGGKHSTHSGWDEDLNAALDTPGARPAGGEDAVLELDADTDMGNDWATGPLPEDGAHGQVGVGFGMGLPESAWFQEGGG